MGCNTRSCRLMIAWKCACHVLSEHLLVVATRQHIGQTSLALQLLKQMPLACTIDHLGLHCIKKNPKEINAICFCSLSQHHIDTLCYLK